MNATHSSIGLHSCPSVARLFRLQWEEVQKSWVLLYPEGMVKLNGSAGEIMARLDGKTAVSAVVQALQVQFHASDSQAQAVQADVLDFLGFALSKGWIKP